MQDIDQIHTLNKLTGTKDLSEIVPYYYVSISRSSFEIKIYNNGQILDDIEKLQPRGLPLVIHPKHDGDGNKPKPEERIQKGDNVII